MQITKDLLRKWSACTDGYGWFVAKFPQGATYSEVQKALRAEKRYDDSNWLTNHVFANLLEEPARIAPLVKTEVEDALAETKDAGKREVWAKRGAAFFRSKSRRSASSPDRDAGDAPSQPGSAQPASGGTGAA